MVKNTEGGARPSLAGAASPSLAGSPLLALLRTRLNACEKEVRLSIHENGLDEESMGRVCSSLAAALEETRMSSHDFLYQHQLQDSTCEQPLPETVDSTCKQHTQTAAESETQHAVSRTELLFARKRVAVQAAQKAFLKLKQNALQSKVLLMAKQASKQAALLRVQKDTIRAYQKLDDKHKLELACRQQMIASELSKSRKGAAYLLRCLKRCFFQRTFRIR